MSLINPYNNCVRKVLGPYIADVFARPGGVYRA